MRFGWIILLLIVLSAPFVARLALVAGRAKAEFERGATDRLIVITPHNADIRDAFARAFSRWHQEHYSSDVELDYRVPGGAADVKRQLAATARANGDNMIVVGDHDPALAWGGGDFFDRELKPLGILQPIVMPPALRDEFKAAFPEPTLAGVKLYDATLGADGAPQPQWIGVCLSSFGICYNPDVYGHLGIPEPSAEAGWRSLTDPKLAGLVALADPAHSGSSAVAYQMVIQHQMSLAEARVFKSHPQLKALPRAQRTKSAIYTAAIAGGWKAGMSELLKIAANARYFTDSSSLVPMDVSRGEAAAGMAIDFYAHVTQESVGSGRIRYVAPAGATAITPDPIAILRGASSRQLELANHFIEFLLCAEGQRLWILRAGAPGGPLDRSLRRMPIRRDVYANRTDWADDADPFTLAKGFNQRGEWMGLFTDSRPMWVAAWIDSRDALQDAYGKILAVSDPVRRAQLIDKLADLPIDMQAVGDLQKERDRLEQSHGDVDLWRARQQIDWAERFRRHYREVAEQAS